MVRMCLEQRLEYRGGLELVGVVLVGGIEIRRGDQRRQDLRLGVVRISGHDRRHGGVEGLHALGIGLRGVPAHEDSDGSDIVLLALALQSRGLRRIECRDDAVETRRRERGWPGERVVEDRHGMAPMRHATGGIGALDRLESGDRLRPGEGMVKRHGRVELCLCGRIAIDAELDRAQARNCVLVCALCLCRYRRDERARRSDAQQYRKRASHGGPLWLCASKRQQDEPVGRPGQARLGAPVPGQWSRAAWAIVSAPMASESDGIPKTPEWAEARCGIPAETIRRLAIEFATSPAAGPAVRLRPGPHCLRRAVPQRRLCAGGDHRQHRQGCDSLERQRTASSSRRKHDCPQ